MPLTGNLRSIIAMLAAMACFSCLDALLKALAITEAFRHDQPGRQGN